MRGWKRLTGRLAFGAVLVLGIVVACARGTDGTGSVRPPPVDTGTPDAGPPPTDAGGTDGGQLDGGGGTIGRVPGGLGEGVWPKINVTYSQQDGLLGGELGSGVVGTTTDESQNIWIATRGALYLKRAPSADGKRPADTTFRRFDGTGGHHSVVDTALHLQGNAITYHDVGLSLGINEDITGAASNPGILSIVGGGPN